MLCPTCRHELTEGEVVSAQLRIIKRADDKEKMHKRKLEKKTSTTTTSSSSSTMNVVESQLRRMRKSRGAMIKSLAKMNEDAKRIAKELEKTDEEIRRLTTLDA